MPAGSQKPRPRTTPSGGVPVPRTIPPATVPVQAPTFGRAPMATHGLAGRVIGDRYGVTSVIGEGGMGVVYEAEHLTLGKAVAIKVLHPRHAQDREAISRLRHEARVAGTLGHPNICAVYDMGRLDDGSPYLVMERLYGETLAQRITREGRISEADMVDILLQILSALAAAHQHRVIHRDLKPDNVFLMARPGVRPVPKLLDFGISKAEDIEDTMADPTGPHLAAGTPYYMAPEQARGDRNFDERVDLWAAGVVLYEGLSGKHPFEAKNYNALLVAILSGAHRPLRELDPKLSPGLAKIVDKALAKRPEDRYQSALEFQNAVRNYKELEVESAHKIMPVVVNEPTNDDSDATTVFSRLDMRAAMSAALADPVPPSEEEKTPIYHPLDSIDDERTIVEPPAFLREQGTFPRREQPGRKR